MQRGKIIFIGVLILIVLLTAVYVVSLTSGKDSSAQSSDFVVPEVTEKEQTKDDYNSRLSKANTYEEKVEKTDLSKSMDFKTYQEETKREVKTDAKTVTTSRERSVRRTALTPRSESRASNLDQEVKQEPVAVIPSTKEEDPGGFGIVVSERSKKSNSASQARRGGFFSASLEEDTKVKNQSSVVFFLLSDCDIDGTTFKKNSVLYGKAYESGNVFDIRINQVMNTDGKVYTVSNIFVYDEKYSRGLPGEGKLNQSVKESASQTSDNLSSSLSSAAAGNGVDLAVTAVDNTIKAINRKKEPSISLMKGYKVFIKQEL